MSPELIECLKSFIRSKHLTKEWNIFRDNWFKSINSEASNERLSVRDNEAQKELLKKYHKYIDTECVAVHLNDVEILEVIEDFFNND